MRSLAFGVIDFGIFNGPLNYMLKLPLDVFEKDLFLRVVVWRKSNDKFIQNETQQVPIDSS